MILKSGLELVGDIKVGDLVCVSQHWSAYVGAQLQEGWTHIGEGIFVGMGTSYDKINGRLIDRVDNICVMMPHGVTWFNPSRLKLSLVSPAEDPDVRSDGADLQDPPWTVPTVH